jgi:hypothetical protein
VVGSHAADAVDADPHINGIDAPHGADIAMPASQKVVDIGPQQTWIDEHRAAEDVAAREVHQLGAKARPQPVLDWCAKADAIDPCHDGFGQVSLGEPAQDAFALAAADLLIIR